MALPISVILTFLLGITAEALRAIIGLKSAISLRRGKVDPKFRVKGGYPAEVVALFTTVSSIRVSRVGIVRVTLIVTVMVSRVSVMVSVRDGVK